MQINSIYLYPNRVDAYLNLDSAWTTERFRMVYARDLKLYRSVDNKIDLQVRNGDQKTVNVTGSTIVFVLVNRENSDLVLKKDCAFYDAAVGRCYVEISTTEMRNIEPGFYTYSLIKETRETKDSTDYTVTRSEPLYIDSQYGATGTIEVYGDLKGEPYDTVTIDVFNKHINFDQAQPVDPAIAPFDLPRPNYARQTPVSGWEEYFYSSLIDAQPNMTTPQSMHTFQIYLNNYAGELVLQGSLAKGADPSDSSWSDLATWNLTTSDPSFYYNQIGKFNWFRFKNTPDSSNTGTIDKVLYR